MTSRAALYLAERDKGLTYKEIAWKYRVSMSAVAHNCVGSFRAYTKDEVIYPNLRRWLNENQVTRRGFAAKIGWTAKNPGAHINGWFRGKRRPTPMSVDKILKVTGLTYEQLFERDAK